MPTIPQSIQTLFNDHQARIAAVSAAPGVVGLSLDLDQISATYLSKEIQIAELEMRPLRQGMAERLAKERNCSQGVLRCG